MTPSPTCISAASIQTPNMKSKVDDKTERDLVWTGIFVACTLICLMLFKYVPDLGSSLVESLPSNLASWAAYEEYYFSTHSVHHARFLGNELVYGLARSLPSGLGSSDVRLHPLRVSATIFTLLWFLVSLLPIWIQPHRFDAQRYLLGLTIIVVAGLYVYYPCDAPSLTWLALALACLLSEKLVAALSCMLITGLFRETSFHMVCMVALWATCAQHRSRANRALWLAAFGLCFAVEYKLIRHWYPGDARGADHYAFLVTAEGLKNLFLGGGFWSLTTLSTLPLAALFPVAWWRFRRHEGRHEWQHKFFLLNCFAFPAWILFYRAQGGNINEFRIMWPFILPCLVGLAWKPTEPAVRSNPGHSS